MTALGVIPARYGSTRLLAKPLHKIKGKPLLEWVVNGVRGAKLLSDLIVATDHEKIANLAESLGVRAVMTDPELPSGSDRVWAAAQKHNANIVINIQGDEPLIAPYWVDNLIQAMVEKPQVEMATLAHELPSNELDEKGTVKVILNRDSEAIYFSRFGIPYSRESIEKWPGVALKHIGLYGYRKNFLQKFCEQKPTPLEKSESLEQLRALWLGAKIHVVKIAGQSIGVDTPEDVTRVEEILAKGERT
ncbi:MAG: 3-deoxy-D-manno-octulosonate cytidylyltransferase [Bdellovibrionales bacterium RBG_16_40_8]|nr:MAG: 3-deoxy-D-manno-octulosonate cytidylyltransferase [Bdellovibrionales bacterium RBG_16_40_8]